MGRGRIDLLVRWPHPAAAGKREWQREALELKVWREKSKDPIQEGLAQLDGYLERLGLDQGTLVVFDRRKRAAAEENADGASAAEPRVEASRTAKGRAVRVIVI